jgi:hypothetical protein
MWRISKINQNFNLCTSYPPLIAVPRHHSITDEFIQRAAEQRSKKRIPALTWLHPNGAPLCRASQPMVGIANASTDEDEALLMAIRATVTGDDTQMGSDSLGTEFDSHRQSVHMTVGTGVSRSSPITSHTANETHNSTDIASRHTSTNTTGNAWTTRTVPSKSTSSDSNDIVNNTTARVRTMSGGGSYVSNSNSNSNSNSRRSNKNAKLRIIDCRPLINSKANAFMGKGHEVVARLGGYVLCYVVKCCNVM